MQLGRLYPRSHVWTLRNKGRPIRVARLPTSHTIMHHLPNLSPSVTTSEHTLERQGSSIKVAGEIV